MSFLQGASLRRLMILLAILLFNSCDQSGHIEQDDEARSMSSVRTSIFKIRTSSQRPNFQRPWTSNTSAKNSGTGFYIGQGRILSNAHVLANARFVSVQRDGDEKAVPAQIEFIADDCDLAILSVSDNEYFSDLKALTFSDLPALHTPVTTVGFPTGGEQLSITSGVVSRIERRRYVHAYDAHHLMIQVDSAINPGNSGGPVLQNGKVLGVAFQSLNGADGTGYVIPKIVVEHFLKDIEDGTYHGYPKLGLNFRAAVTANPATVAYHQLPKNNPGVKLDSVDWWSPFAEDLQEGDILMKIEGQEIGSDGRIAWNGERVSFKSVFDGKQLGEQVVFNLVRNDKNLVKTLAIGQNKPSPNLGNNHENEPAYAVIGGVIFTTLNRSFLKSYGYNWYYDVPPLIKYLYFYGTHDPYFRSRKEFVVAVGKLDHPINTYIELAKPAFVDQVQGVRVSSLRQLVEASRKSDDKFFIVDLYGDQEPLAFIQKDLAKANEQITSTYKLGKNYVFNDSQSNTPRVKQWR